MSRYIDAEWLKSRVHDVPLANGAIHGCVDKLDLIEAPSIDIVRCEECIYYSDGECKSGTLPFSEYSDMRNVWLTPKPTDFCSYGERKGYENV